MELTKLTASKRNTKGKGPARRMRGEGKIPAIAYGSKMDPLALSVAPGELAQHLQGEYGLNTIFDLDIEGTSFTAIVADYQYHPVSRALLHADFKRIALDEEVEIEVPFKLTGKPKGVTAGGTLEQVYRKLPVRSLPLSIPVEIVHDVTELELDESVAASDVKLPEGVKMTLPPQRTVATVHFVKVRIEEEEAATAAAGATPAADAAAKPAAGAAAKPAAGAAAAAKPGAKPGS